MLQRAMTRAFATLCLLVLSCAAAWIADRLSLPLPYMLGPLVSSGAVAILVSARLPVNYQFPGWLRLTFITVIGLMIGAQVTPELFANAGRLAISFAALTLFVGLCLAFNYAVFRRLGRYDPATAFYCSTPGGLYESLALGEAAGADPARLTLQQFLRVILVVTALPIALSLWLGAPVGSAGGMTLARPDVPWSDLPWIISAGIGGIVAGRVLRLPAGQITGPMAVAAALSLTGVYHVDVPQWLVNAAQIVVGTALGMRFAGLNRGLILRGVGLSVISVGGMLALAALFAALLAPLTGQPFTVMLISFAPGGVTEMALVALSLQANPAYVTLHHIYRILITVIGLALSAAPLRRGL